MKRQFIQVPKLWQPQDKERLDCESNELRVHEITDDIMQVLQDKHPEQGTLSPEVEDQYSKDISAVEPVIFEEIDELAIYTQQQRTHLAPQDQLR